MTKLLSNKVCVVTGAGKGFGRSIAEKFFEHGAKLALITRSQDDVDSLYSDLGVDNSNFFALCGDVSEAETVNNFALKVRDKFGRIDVLVNNAGIRFRKKFQDMSSEEFQNVFNVNVLSMFHTCKAILPVMQEQKKGKIINLSSIAGTLGLPDLSGYVTSKAAIIGLTKSLALEYAEDNIQINALAPGFCKTSYFNNFKQKEDLYDFTLERTPMRRWGESEEIANSCLYLASSLSDYVTGEIHNVDGGWSAW